VVTHFPCPYLQTQVELTEERERHIAERHPDLLLEQRTCIADTLAESDQVRLQYAIEECTVVHSLV
jgi:hypothetical protein